MIKYKPSIIIHNLEIADEKDETVYQNLYFLSHKRAKRFWEKHEKELKGYKVSLRGEQLWLW